MVTLVDTHLTSASKRLRDDPHGSKPSKIGVSMSEMRMLKVFLEVHRDQKEDAQVWIRSIFCKSLKILSIFSTGAQSLHSHPPI